MKLFRTSAVLTAAVLGLTTLSARATLVDDFSDTTTTWPLILPNGSHLVTTSETFTAGVGGTRAATVTMVATTSAPTRPQVSIFTPTGSSHGVFDFAETSYDTAATNLLYTLTPQDWTGTHFLDLAIDTYDFPSSVGLPVAISVNGSAPLTATYSAVGPGDLIFDLATIPGINLAAVTSLSLSFTPPKGADFSISEIDVTRTTVPEPASMALLTPAGLLLLRRSRR